MKGRQSMETGTGGTLYQEEHQARIERPRETGRVTAIVRGVMCVLMEGTTESELFAAYVEKDAFYIEFLTIEDATDLRLSA